MFGIKLLITQPTRFRDTSESLIDPVLANKHNC